MRRALAFMGLGLTLLSVSLTGCGEGEKTGDIVDAPEAVSADEAGRAAMQDFMKSQQKGAAK